MSGRQGTPSGPAGSEVDEAGRGSRSLRRARVALGALVVWTVFVWTGRIRNALADPDLEGAQRMWPLLLAASFLVPAVLLAFAWVGSRRSGRWIDPWASLLVRVLASWTVGVWLLRVADIALGGDWSIGFVVVHSVLGVVSIVLAVWAAVTDRAAAPARGHTPGE